MSDATLIKIGNWLYNQEILGAVVGFILTVLFVQYIIPLFSKKRKIASNKLANFYNVAHMFVMIRENFSVVIGKDTHNKNNCGFFHDFNSRSVTEESQTIDTDSGNVILSTIKTTKTSLILDEMEFFEYFTKNVQYVDTELKDVFIQYLRRRFADTAANNLNCSDKKLVTLRRKIEKLVVRDYTYYVDNFY